MDTEVKLDGELGVDFDKGHITTECGKISLASEAHMVL